MDTEIFSDIFCLGKYIYLPKKVGRDVKNYLKRNSFYFLDATQRTKKKNWLQIKVLPLEILFTLVVLSIITFKKSYRPIWIIL